jgi:hypothetical protein
MHACCTPQFLLLQTSKLTPACVHSLHDMCAFAWHAMTYALLKVLLVLIYSRVFNSGLWCQKLYVGWVGVPKSVAHRASGCCASCYSIVVCQAIACAGRANS